MGLTLGAIGAGVWASLRGPSSVVLVELEQKTVAHVLVGALALFPFLALGCGQLLLGARGSTSLCVTAILVSGLSLAGYGGSASGPSPTGILRLMSGVFGGRPGMASLELGSIAFVSAVQCVVAWVGLFATWAMFVWSEQPHNNELQRTKPAQAMALRR